MARHQTRKSISVSGSTYTKLREFCRTNKKSMSGVTEELLVALLDGRIRLFEGMAAMLADALFPKPARDTVKTNPSGPGYDEATIAARRANDNRQF